MSGSMSMERATEFGEAWNSHDATLVVSYFAPEGEYHASVGTDRLGASYLGKDEVRRGVQTFFDRFPDGRFEDLRVNIAGNWGTFEWDFVYTNAEGEATSVAGCDLLEFTGDKILKKNAFRKCLS